MAQRILASTALDQRDLSRDRRHFTVATARASNRRKSSVGSEYLATVPRDTTPFLSEGSLFLTLALPLTARHESAHRVAELAMPTDELNSSLAVRYSPLRAPSAPT